MKKSVKSLLVTSLWGASGIETNAGNAVDWGTLEALGLVTRMGSGGGLGHRFCFEVTPKGRQKIQDILAAMPEEERAKIMDRFKKVKP
jgi:hypothetical protein